MVQEVVILVEHVEILEDGDRCIKEEVDECVNHSRVFILGNEAVWYGWNRRFGWPDGLFKKAEEW